MKKRILVLSLALSMLLGTTAMAAEYTVVKGDSLSKIAEKQLGDISRWTEIYEANKDAIKDPNKILVGQKLTIPGGAAETVKPSTNVEVDTFTSASVADYYGDYILEGDELMNAINSFAGTYLISTVNPDGSPLIAYFIYGCVKDRDTYYLQLGLANNQTRENAMRTGKVMAAYAAAPSDMPYSMAGARMTATVVTDEALTKRLNNTGYETTFYAEITEVRSLG